MHVLSRDIMADTRAVDRLTDMLNQELTDLGGEFIQNVFYRQSRPFGDLINMSVVLHREDLGKMDRYKIAILHDDLYKVTPNQCRNMLKYSKALMVSDMEVAAGKTYFQFVEELFYSLGRGFFEDIILKGRPEAIYTLSSSWQTSQDMGHRQRLVATIHYEEVA